MPPQHRHQRLRARAPAGNNLAWFSPHSHHTAEPVPTAEALQILLIHHYYGRSGRGTPAPSTAPPA
ncbi:hypothetical protein ACR6C2_00830 [Streptomyces sp. INA 01156]